jgi:YggT family protein
MSGDYFSDAGLFLIDTVLGLYILIVLLRFLFQITGADFYNPISQFIVKASNPPLRRLRRIVPGLWGIDFAAVILLIVLEGIRIGITALLIGRSPELAGVLVLSIAELLKLGVYVMVFSIFIRALLSWISMGKFHPMLQLLHSFTEPLMAPARRILPTTNGLDLSPIIVFIVLMLALKLIIQPMLDLGRILI